MNRLHVRTRPIKWDDGPEDPDNLLTEVLVDGELLVDFEDNYLQVNLGALKATISRDGEFFIVTCSCGVPQCAGIYEGIHVSRDRNNVHWVVRGLTEETQTFYFRRGQYANTIRRAIKEYRKLSAKYDLYGLY